MNRLTKTISAYRYEGKHRAEKQPTRRFDRIKKAVGALCVGLTLSTGTTINNAPAAEAATGDQWDQVAQCESGGNWNIDTGNGFRGGLQFTDQTWAGFGGTGSAANASREEQIAVAERVLAVQGPGAWPTCGGNLTSGGYIPTTVETTPAVVEPREEAQTPVYNAAPQNYVPQVSQQVEQQVTRYAVNTAVDIATPVAIGAVAVIAPPVAPLAAAAAPLLNQMAKNEAYNFVQNQGGRGGWQMMPQGQDRGWGQERAQGWDKPDRHDFGGKQHKKPCNR